MSSVIPVGTHALTLLIPKSKSTTNTDSKYKSNTVARRVTFAYMLVP